MKIVFRYLANSFLGPQGDHMADDFLAVTLKFLAVLGEDLFPDLAVPLLSRAFLEIKNGPHIAKKALHLYLALATKSSDYEKVSSVVPAKDVRKRKLRCTIFSARFPFQP
jgi:hypothetical protein